MFCDPIYLSPLYENAFGQPGVAGRKISGKGEGFPRKIIFKKIFKFVVFVFYQLNQAGIKTLDKGYCIGERFIF